MSERMVHCVKLGREAPGLPEPPIPGELGQKVFENVSQEGWDQFLEYFKMIINEYRLNLMDDATDEIFNKSVEDFFFGEGGKMPEGYVPPQTKG
ncbi:MAG: oxidative damage protection protein [Nitrospinota bacterium]